MAEDVHATTSDAQGTSDILRDAPYTAHLLSHAPPLVHSLKPNILIFEASSSHDHPSLYWTNPAGLDKNPQKELVWNEKEVHE